MLLFAMAVWAIWRGVKHGQVLLNVLLLLAIFIGPTAFRSPSSSVFHNATAWWPLAIFSLIQCVAGWRTSNHWKTFAGLAAAAFLPLIVLKTFLAFMATQVANRSQSGNVTAGVVFLCVGEDNPVQR